MNDIVRIVLGELSTRGRQRGFLVVSEIQQELEDAEAPPESFDEVIVALQEQSVTIREDSENALRRPR